MNRLRSSTSCRLCRTWLESGWSRATLAVRRSLDRQMASGLCDACQRRRQAAAVRLILATDVVRVFTRMNLRPPEAIADAARRAERDCVALMMWSPTRRQHDTTRFRETGAKK